MKHKSILAEYLIGDKFEIWQRMWEFSELEFVIDDFKKSVQKEARWFVKKGFLTKRKVKGETAYKVNRRKKIVRIVFALFVEILSYDIKDKIKKAINE